MALSASATGTMYASFVAFIILCCLLGGSVFEVINKTVGLGLQLYSELGLARATCRGRQMNVIGLER